MINDVLLRDTEQKIKDILKRYYDIKESIEILKDQIELLKELLQSDDSTELIDRKEGSGKYNSDSVVEKEVLFNLHINKAIEIKRLEIKKDITRLETAVKIKSMVISHIDRVLKNVLAKDEVFVLKYYYIDKKINNDKNIDVVNRYNQGKKYIYSDKKIENLRDKALKIISLKFININHLLKDV